MLLVWSRATTKPAGMVSSWCPASHDPHSGEGGTVEGSELKPGGQQDAVMNNVKGKPCFRKHDEGKCSRVAPPSPRCRIGLDATRSSRATPPRSPTARGPVSLRLVSTEVLSEYLCPSQALLCRKY